MSVPQYYQEAQSIFYTQIRMQSFFNIFGLCVYVCVCHDACVIERAIFLSLPCVN